MTTLRSLLFFFLIIPVMGTAKVEPPYRAFATDTLTIITKAKKIPLAIELARSREQMELGLMYRKTLPKHYGMLFDFGSPQPISMWMKNTLIPLDMLFIDETGRIIFIRENATPGSEEPISAGKPVRGVLELAGGNAKVWHIQRGDYVDHPIFGRR